MVEITYQMVLSTIQTISLVIGIIYYITIMRHQQRTQEQAQRTRQAELLTHLYDRDMDRDNMKAQNYAIEMTFNSINEFEEKYEQENNPEGYLDWATHLNYMEGLGVQVREGFLDVRIVALMSGGLVKLGWEKFEPVIKEYRIKYNWPRWGIEYEYLYHALMKYAKENPEIQIPTN